MGNIISNQQKLQGNLSRWIPAIRRIAFEKGAVISDDAIIEILKKANIYFKKHFAGCFDKDIKFAVSIKIVFQEDLNRRASLSRKIKESFVSEWVQPKINILTKNQCYERR